MKLLIVLLLLATVVTLVSGATQEYSELCDTEIRCVKADSKEYAKCLERIRIKRQTCKVQNTISEPQIVHLPTIPCNSIYCNQNVAQIVQPCSGGSYCDCINSCARFCSGVRCGDRCQLSCPVYQNAQPSQIIYLPMQTVVQPNPPQIYEPMVFQPKQPQVVQPIQSFAQLKPPPVVQPTETVISSNLSQIVQSPSQILSSNQTVALPKEEVTIFDPLSLVQPPRVVDPPMLYNSTTRILNTTTEIDAKSSNITSNINVTNIVNNTNIVNVPTDLNNTNINNIDFGNITAANRQTGDNSYPVNEGLKEDTVENISDRCCFIVQPKVCDKGPGGGDLCTQRQNRVCGEQCLNSSERVLDRLSEDYNKDTDIPRCCVVVQPRVCEKVNSAKGAVRCTRRKHHTCGEECTSDTLHAQVRQPCNGPPESCPPQVAYVPQPQPHCSYQPIWPYVSCGTIPSSCAGCYDHYGYGFHQYYGANQPSCGGCYDDGHQPGSLYRQGPYYQPGYYHTPPATYAPQPSSCGSYGCFGNDRVDPVFGVSSYSPYGISPQYFYPPQYVPQYSTQPLPGKQILPPDQTIPLNPPGYVPYVRPFPQPDTMHTPQYPPWFQYPQYSNNPFPPCYILPYYQPQLCPALFFPPPPMYPPLPYPGFPGVAFPSAPNGTMPLPLPPRDQPPVGPLASLPEAPKSPLPNPWADADQ